MTIDSIVLAALCAELNTTLSNGRVDKVQQPSPLEIVLTIRANGANYSLLISADAQSPRIHVSSSRRKSPPTPPNFCMLLRKYLEGAHLASVTQPSFDRIVHVTFLAYDGERITLIFEAMGKHSNLILVSGIGRILGAIKPIGRQKNRYREILPGRDYVAPPSQEKSDPRGLTRDEILSRLSEAFPDEPADHSELATWLVKSFSGVSPFAAREIVERSKGSTNSIADEFVRFFELVRISRFVPVYITDDSGRMISFYAFPSVQYPADNQHERTSINGVADMYYTSALPRQALEQAKSEVLGRIRREIVSAREALEEIHHGIEQGKDAERLKQIGELILSQQGSIPAKSSEVELYDYYDPACLAVRVQLDERLSAVENASLYFRRYQKALSGAQALSDRLGSVEKTLEFLCNAESSVESMESLEDIESIVEQLASSGINIRRQEVQVSDKRKPEFEGHHIHKTNISGWEVLIGQNSEANDYLVARVAKPNDWWLHVKAATSAHVVIRTNGKPDSVPRDVLVAAANLTAQNSEAKHSSLVPVDYTLRKYVRKPKGAVAGRVIYQNERTIYITPNG